MIGDTGAMKNTRFEKMLSYQIPRGQQIQRLKALIQSELTDLQRYTIVAYYFEGKKLYQIARERGVNKSTVSRITITVNALIQKMRPIMVALRFNISILGIELIVPGQFGTQQFCTLFLHHISYNEKSPGTVPGQNKKRRLKTVRLMPKIIS